MGKEPKNTNNAFQRTMELLSLASHEMRTPLVSITSLIQLILEGKVGKITPKQKEYLSIAFHDATNLKLIITNMIDVTNFERGDVLYSFAKFDILEMLNECLGTVKILSSDKGVTVSLQKSAPITITGDKARIKQVVINLMTNAVKYGNKGGHVWISIEKKGNDAIIAVKDNGIGVSKENIKKLFTKQFQVEKDPTKTQSGLGYGLYITKKIVEEHGGKVWCESQLKKGSTFFVSLPIKSSKKTKKI
jgi:signal transduction histidine kinase